MKAAAKTAQENQLPNESKPVVMLTVDTLMALVERVGSLERAVAELRTAIAKNHDEAAGNLQKSLDSVYSQCIPDLLPDGRLQFKAYDDNASPVLGVVQAEIRTED